MNKKLLTYSLILSTIAISSISLISQASAENGLTLDELKIYNANNISFYLPCSDGTYSGLSGNISISGSTMEEKVWSGLTSFLSDEQAAGVMGNIKTESGFNPLSRQSGFQDNSKLRDTSGGTAVGLIQWDGGRKTKMLDYIESQDPSLMQYFEDGSNATLSADDLAAKIGEDNVNKIVQLELEYLKKELDDTSTYNGYYSQTGNASDNADWFREHVEGTTSAADKRKNAATDYYSQYSGKTIEGGSSSGSSMNYCNTYEKGGKNINATAVNLAHPQGTKKSDYAYSSGSPTKNYTDAVSAINGDDSRVNLSDCGEFVKTVVRYSGVDENYKQFDLNYTRNSDKWDVIEWNGDKSQLQAGDIVEEYSSDHRTHHTYIVVQDQNGNLVRAESVRAGSKNESFGHLDEEYRGPTTSKYSDFYIIRAKNANNSTAGVDFKNGVSPTNTNCYNICNPSSGGGSGALVSGGMTLAQAQDWIKFYHDKAMGEYYKKNQDTTLNFNGRNVKIHDADCTFGVLNNCVALSQFFVNAYTSLGPSWNNTTNGVDLVDRLVSAGFKSNGNTPIAYSIFSSSSVTAAGHTGVVLGVDTENKKVIIAEASCSEGQSKLYYEPRVREVSLSEAQKWTYAYDPNMKGLQ